MKRGRKELAAALALVALGLAGCGSAVKAPMTAEASGPPVQVYAAGSLREAQVFPPRLLV